MNYNICQITSQDINDADEVTVQIPDLSNNRQLINYTYKILYKKEGLLKSDQIIKFGYCANNNQGMNYPIFLNIPGQKTTNYDNDIIVQVDGENVHFHMFMLGKTGMFEFQPEFWKDVNSKDEEEQAGLESEVYLSTILVPKDISFVIDYCYLLS